MLVILYLPFCKPYFVTDPKGGWEQMLLLDAAQREACLGKGQLSRHL